MAQGLASLKQHCMRLIGFEADLPSLTYYQPHFRSLPLYRSLQVTKGDPCVRRVSRAVALDSFICSWLKEDPQNEDFFWLRFGLKFEEIRCRTRSTSVEIEKFTSRAFLPIYCHQKHHRPGYGRKFEKNEKLCHKYRYDLVRTAFAHHSSTLPIVPVCIGLFEIRAYCRSEFLMTSLDECIVFCRQDGWRHVYHKDEI
jgi:hypothetical protein